jgi:hypothetical protein
MLLTWFIYANAMLSRGWVMGKKSGGILAVFTEIKIIHSLNPPRAPRPEPAGMMLNRLK